MHFVELDYEEFRNVCNNFEGNSFYQSIEWARIKKHTGWICYFVGIKKKNQVIACSLVLGKKIFFNKYLYYAPRGMLLNYNDFVLLEFFVKEIYHFLKLKNGVVFKIDPLVSYKNHDRDGNYVNDGFSNQLIIDNLVKLGFKHYGFSTGYSDEAQFRWSYCLDVTQPINNIFENMNQRCRRCIRKSEKYPLEVVEVNDNNILDFKGIMEHTASRQDQFDRTLDYYKNINNFMDEKSKLLIVYLNKEKFLSDFKNDKLYDIINNDNRKMIPISAGVFIIDSSRVNYVYGGTYKNYMSLMAQYKLQIEMIHLAKDKGLPLYDFGGISGNFDSSSKNFGVYDFKRGFGGYVVEYIGEFDLILNKFCYMFYNLGYKLYRNLKHLFARIRRVI